ncbi:hypothetical protein [Enterococcus mundtii]|uniref:hypothetical protein n=1 Tax=Enterococcus mundtii TaxID=53346 RepID=UPI001A97B44A|nr:hypothetical protein [Enterococcus mundtii]MBO1087126.1 hypothetical protein [Enterococcus mundtii]
MARKRKGLSGDLPESKKTNKPKSHLDDYFDELIVSSGDKDEQAEETTSSSVEAIAKPINIEDLPKIETKETTVDSENVGSSNDQSTADVSQEEQHAHIPIPTPTVKVKGGKPRIVTTKKEAKLSRADFTKLNENNKYNLQKKTEENAKQLATVTRTLSIRPDLLDIFKDIVDNQYGLSTKIVNNALIKELVDIGILDEDSYSELIEY